MKPFFFILLMMIAGNLYAQEDCSRTGNLYNRAAAKHACRAANTLERIEKLLEKR